MSESQETREEYPYRRNSAIPFVLGLSVLVFFVAYPSTPNLMRGLSSVVLLLALLFFILTRGRFKGIWIEDGLLQVTNGLRVIQSFQVDDIEKISKDGASFAVDYKDTKTGRLARHSVLKGSFSEETWDVLSRKLSSMR